MIGETASPYALVFKSLKSVKKNSITLIGNLFLSFFIKKFLYSNSNNIFLKLLKLKELSSRRT